MHLAVIGLLVKRKLGLWVIEEARLRLVRIVGLSRISRSVLPYNVNQRLFTSIERELPSGLE